VPPSRNGKVTLLQPKSSKFCLVVMKNSLAAWLLLLSWPAGAQLCDASFFVRSVDGTPGKLSDYCAPARTTLLVLWSTEVSLSRQVLDELSGLSSELQERGVQVVALSCSPPRDALRIQGLAKSRNWRFVVALDRENAAPAFFKCSRMPALILFDPKGREVARLETPGQPLQPLLAEWIERLQGEGVSERQ